MVELYLEARLHNRISDADYRALLLRQALAAKRPLGKTSRPTPSASAACCCNR